MPGRSPASIPSLSFGFPAKGNIMSRIAFLGLGAMGSLMALNLIRAGHEVTVWNRSPAAVEPVVEAGATTAANPREAATGAEFILSMLTDDEAARHVWIDPETGAAKGMAQGALAIECSTVSPGWVRELRAALAMRGNDLVDAPVAGSRPQAEAGQLIFMAGGGVDAIDAARPVLAAMGPTLIHVGETGQGAMLKLAVNAFFAAQLVSMSEMLALLARSGIAGSEAAAMLARFPVTSPALAGAARLMAVRDGTPMFTVDLIAKDLGYALAEGEAADVSLPATKSSLDAFRRVQDAGRGHENITALAAIHDTQPAWRATH
jgi:3-hydroxyisobutyrate dehydrogenase-like beta-hydroxyacid dehydrogenase